MGPGLALLLGSALPYLLPQPLAGWGFGALLLAVIAALLQSRTRLLAMLLLGFGLTELTLQQRLQQRLPEAMSGTPITVTGVVSSLPQTDARSIRFDLDLSHSEPPLPMRRIRLSWYQGHPQVQAGQQLQLQVKLRRPHGMVNPAGYDYERQALLRGIDASGYVVRATGPTDPTLTLHALRERGSQRLQEVLGDNRASALLRALVYGDTRFLTDADWRLFRHTGTTHLIAISGSHIGVVAVAAGLLVALLWRWIGPLRRWPRWLVASLGGTLAAAIYCLLAGFEVPAQRTLVGLCVVTLTWLLRRQLSPWHALNAALVAVLLYDPLSPLSAGFWLSFGAVAWLLLIFAGRWRHPSWWRELLEAQWKIGVLLLPLGALLFQHTTPLALPTNLWAVPLVSVLLVPLALMATALLWVPLLGALLLELAALLAKLFLLGLDLSVQAGGQPLALALPGPLALALAMFGAVLLIAPRGMPARWVGALALLPMLWPAARPLGPGQFDLTVFDVGQGLSVLVRTQHHDLLYDTGPGREDGEPIAALTVLPSLATLGVRKLDRIVVSHGDDDHAGGLAAIMQALPDSRVLGSAPAQGQSCLAGQRWHWDGVRFEFLHPTPGLPYLGNQSSCVLHISGSNGSALLPGDIGRDIEQRLLRQPQALAADLLVSPHHGSSSSSTEAFVQAVGARWVIHASGYRDRFGFPRPDVVQRYIRNGARQYDTGSAGAIRIGFDQEQGQWQAQALRLAQPRRWRNAGNALAP